MWQAGVKFPMTSPTIRLTDPRARRSLEALSGALCDLLEAAPLDTVSITKLVETAGVTRPTFYQHFSDVPDAARRVALARLQAAFPAPVVVEAAAGPERLFVQVREAALPVLEHLTEHRIFYLHVLEGAGNVRLLEEVVGFLVGRIVQENAVSSSQGGIGEDLRTVLAGGVMWLVIRWLRQGASQTPSVHMADRIANATVNSLRPGGAST